jgi:hypothetical protein
MNSDTPPFFCILRNILTPEECAAIISDAEGIGFEPAALRNENYDFEIRRSQRCIIDSPDFAMLLWERIQEHVPFTWDGGEVVVGLNERLRILKYEPGDEFRAHADGSYIAPDGALSKITVLVYLNEGYEGGFTNYVMNDGVREVQPAVGSVVLQDQNIIHYVPALKKGVKYALRTEVMYRVVASSSDYKTISISY